MLKVELHTHSSDDPVDCIPYSTLQLIDRAAQLGTTRWRLRCTTGSSICDRSLVSLRPYRGITLIPGIERTIEGRHVLLLNFSPATEARE